MQQPRQVLVLNCGSSSVKYALFDEADTAIERGRRERLGKGEGGVTHAEAIRDVLASLRGHRIDAVGHRVVHGGASLRAPVPVDPEFDRNGALAAIEAAAPAAPLHNPFALDAIRAVGAALPDVPQVASFDTAFHASLPRRATTYAIDREVALAHDIRRYGFHGLSHEYVAGIAAGFLERPLNELRLVVLHLGNGASACAVEYGRSAETSMGATPLEGLVMGTRSGDVDAGALLALLRNGHDVDSLDALLNERSGLVGLSGLSGDLREIEEAAAAGDDRARLAIDVFAHRARKYIGAYAAAMGGIDAIVFTGGIGENSPSMRGRILQRLEFLGANLDHDANRDASVRADHEYAMITTVRSRVVAVVVKSNEELMIARQARTVLSRVAPDAASRGEDAASRPTPSAAGAREPLAVPVAISARHCHLSAVTFAKLFGAQARPTPDKPLSQPDQYACVERVTLVGPRERIENVRVLGPLREFDQVEIARSDEFRLGVDAPVRDSGKVKDSAPIVLVGPAGRVELAEGLICARRHVHMHPEDAGSFGVADGDSVAVSIVGGPRDLVFGDVLIRVGDAFKLELHIDTDEANAAGLGPGSTGALSAVDVDDAGSGLDVVYTEVDGVRGHIAA